MAANGADVAGFCDYGFELHSNDWGSQFEG
jgi:hypothetical protein